MKILNKNIETISILNQKLGQTIGEVFPLFRRILNFGRAIKTGLTKEKFTNIKKAAGIAIY